MSLISDALHTAGEQQQAGRRRRLVPRALKESGPRRRKKKLFFLMLILIVLGPSAAAVVHHYDLWPEQPAQVAKAVTSAAKQMVLSKIPRPSPPEKNRAPSSHDPGSVKKQVEIYQGGVKTEEVKGYGINKSGVHAETAGKRAHQSDTKSGKQREIGPQKENLLKEGADTEGARLAKLSPAEPVKAKRVMDAQSEALQEHSSTPAQAGAKRLSEGAPGKKRLHRGAATHGGLVSVKTQSDTDGVALYRQAVSYQKQMRWKTAIDAYRELLAIEPTSAEVYNNIGVCYEKVGKLKLAAKMYEKAISINPHFYPSYNNLGIIFYRLKKFDKARAAYEQALELHPGNAQSEINLALVYERLQRHERAERTLQRVLVYDPTNAEAHYNLGRILEEQDRPEAALAHYHQFLASTLGKYQHLRERVRERVHVLQTVSKK